jgi:hypothetical protein
LDFGLQAELPWITPPFNRHPFHRKLRIPHRLFNMAVVGIDFGNLASKVSVNKRRLGRNWANKIFRLAWLGIVE